MAGVVCLVPVRNAAADLPGFFEAAARVCDAIVALDDGSLDSTGELLAAEPLVKVLLRNPRRPDYQDWDDASNRNRLLVAAAELEPEWILSLDADERIDPGDAAALRDFLATDALPGCAYGFRHVPMRGDADHFVARYQWVWRLFSYGPGQRFPDARLHFAPVPTAIPRERWLRTTLRIQHLGGMTGERRLARFAKYLEADPARDYQADYSTLLRTPAAGEIRRWVPRPAGLPVLLGAVGTLADDDLGPLTEWDGGTAGRLDGGDETDEETGTVLSAIVIARNDEATIARTVRSVVEQVVPEPFEVIVVVSGEDRTAAVVREQFPGVTLVELERPALPGEARNAGLKRAIGSYVSFPGSHVELPPGSLAARLAAHRRGYAMVTGVAENGTHTAAGWASYFIDHHAGLPGHRPAELDGPPAHCSYARLPLLEVGGFPEGVRTGEDTAVNRAMVRRGYVAFRDPAVRFLHRSPCRTPWQLVRHHFKRGRGWGRLLVDDHRERGKLINREVLADRLIRHVPDRVGRIRRYVGEAEPELGQALQRVLPLVVVGTTASWAGMWWEILRPSPGKAAILFGRPIWSVLLVPDGEAPPVLLRIDRVAGEVQVLRLPRTLPVDGGRLDEALRSAIRDEGRGEARRREGEKARSGIDGVLERVRGVVRGATDLEVDDLVVGPTGVVGRIVGRAAGLGTAGGSWLGVVTAVGKKDLVSSIGVVRLVGLARALRRLPLAEVRANEGRGTRDEGRRGARMAEEWLP